MNHSHRLSPQHLHKNPTPPNSSDDDDDDDGGGWGGGGGDDADDDDDDDFEVINGVRVGRLNSGELSEQGYSFLIDQNCTSFYSVNHNKDGV